MIKLENIHKLDGVEIGGWTCYGIEEHKDHYTIEFSLNQYKPVITQFSLFKEDEIKGLWKLKARMENRGIMAGQFHSSSYMDTQALSKDDFQTFDAFCRTLMRILHKFNDVLRIGVPTYHTASIVSNVTKRINGGGHSFGGHQIPKPPPISAPQWYVPKEEVKLPTMWETFKEMVKWDKWIGILFPMKQAVEQVIPKKKKITAKKAAY